MDKALEIVLGFTKAIYPPDPSDLVQLRRWMMNVSTTLVFIMGLLGLSISMAAGWVPGSGGVAWASNLDALASQQVAFRRDQLEASLYAMQKDLCLYRNSGNMAAAQVQYQVIQNMQFQYQSLNKGIRYTLPDCSLFVASR